MKNSGFTMIELLMAMAIFIIIVSIASGIFVQSLRAQRAIINLMAINDNASLAVEQMAREIRTGEDFFLSSPDDLTSLDFINAKGEAITYRLKDEFIERGINNIFNLLTAEEVKIRKLNFILNGEEAGDNIPTRVTIILSIGSDERIIKDITTNIQTTVSPRISL